MPRWWEEPPNTDKNHNSKKTTGSPPPPYCRDTSGPQGLPAPWCSQHGDWLEEETVSFDQLPEKITQSLHRLDHLTSEAFRKPPKTQQDKPKDTAAQEYVKASIALHNLYRSRGKGSYDDVAKEAISKKVKSDIELARKLLKPEPNDEAIIKFYGAEKFVKKWGNGRSLAFSILWNKYEKKTTSNAGREEALFSKVEADIEYAKERTLLSEPTDDEIIKFYGAEGQHYYLDRD